jgi:hypothetical protein
VSFDEAFDSLVNQIKRKKEKLAAWYSNLLNGGFFIPLNKLIMDMIRL